MKLLVQPGDGIAPLLKGIDRAKSSVEIYIFRFDQIELERALTNAVKRGLSVHALIAHLNGSGEEALRKLEMRLLEGGVTVARTAHGLARYHAKLMIVDRRELHMLAFNFTHHDIERSRSFGLITKNRSLVQEAAKLFEADSKRQPYKPGSPSFVVSPVNARKQLSSFIKGAKSELLIYDPKISDRAMIQLLEERSKANVAIRIIGRVAGKSKLSARKLVSSRLHTRSIIRDRKWVFIGSQSLRELELDGRREVGIICRDRAVVNGVAKIFEEDWARSEPCQAGEETAAATKVAKKVAKAVAKDLGPMGPNLNGTLKEIAGDEVAADVDAEEIEDAVKLAVKETVSNMVEQAIEQEMESRQSSDE